MDLCVLVGDRDTMDHFSHIMRMWEQLCVLSHHFKTPQLWVIAFKMTHRTRTINHCVTINLARIQHY